MYSRWIRHKTSDLIRSALLTIGDGYRAKNSELSTTGLPFARAGNIDAGFQFDDADHFPEPDLYKVGDKISEPGDVVFTSKGTVGRFAFVKADTPRFVYSPQLCYWRSLNHETIYPRFLYYWMHGREFWLQANRVKGQTDMADYVSLGDQRQMHLTLPPIEEQKAIARILGSLDDKIEMNQQMNHTLKEMSWLIYKSWFVDFDPVVARLEGRQAYGVDQSIIDLFPDKFQDCQLGPIPTGWAIKKVRDICELAYGKALVASNRCPGDIMVFGSDGQIGWHDTPLVRGPGIVIGRKGNAGKVNWAASDFFPIDTTFYVVPRSTRISFYYLFYALASLGLDTLAGDSAVPGLSRDLVYSIDILVPEDESNLLMQAFDQRISFLQQIIDANNAETQNLTEIRDKLLAKLISGEIPVKQAEKLLETV